MRATRIPDLTATAPPRSVRSSRLRRLTVLAVLLLGIVVESAALWWLQSVTSPALAIFAVLGSSMLGTILLASVARRTLRELRVALRSGAVDELGRAQLDGALGLAAGVLLLIPGLVNSVVGLLIYLLRPLLRKPVAAFLARRARGLTTPTFGYRDGSSGASAGTPDRPDVVQGTVVDPPE